MCYDDNARAPLPPGTNGSAQGEDLVLQASDGNRFAAYVARPEHSTGAQILIFPDVRGLHQFYKDQNNSHQPIFTVGFCRGGSFSLLSATRDFGQAGAIGFYAGLSRVFAGSTGSILNLSSQIRYPVLGLFGGADPGIPSTDVQALDANLDKAGVEHEIVVYPDAPHSFFDRRSADFAEASSDAWRRVLGFIKAHTPA